MRWFAARNQPTVELPYGFTDAQNTQNRLWADTRCTGVRTFGILKRNAGWLDVAWVQHQARFKFAA